MGEVGGESETCRILKHVTEGENRPLGACAHGKSSDLTIWVTPHQEAKTDGPERVENHLFPTLEGRGRRLGCPLSFIRSYLE